MSGSLLTLAPLGVYNGSPNANNPAAEATFESHSDSFTTLMGVAPTYFDAYTDFGAPISLWADSAAYGAYSSWNSPVTRGMTPVIGLGMYSTAAGAGTPDQQYKGFIAGTYDSVLQNIVKAWAGNGYKTLVFRPGWEMNIAGPTYVGSDAQSQADWVAAFQHIYTVLHQAAATCGVDVSVVWNPGAISWSNVNAITQLYPGNAYVDAIGADMYSNVGPFTLYDWSTGKTDASLAQWMANPVNLEHYWSLPAATQWISDASSGHSLSFNAILKFAEQQGKPFAVPETGAGGSSTGNDLQDNPYFPQWLAQQLSAAQAGGETISFVNIWNSNDGGNYAFTGNATKPEEAAAWAQYFGAQPAATSTQSSTATTSAASSGGTQAGTQAGTTTSSSTGTSVSSSGTAALAVGTGAGGSTPGSNATASVAGAGAGGSSSIQAAAASAGTSTSADNNAANVAMTGMTVTEGRAPADVAGASGALGVQVVNAPASLPDQAASAPAGASTLAGGGYMQTFSDSVLMVTQTGVTLFGGSRVPTDFTPNAYANMIVGGAASCTVEGGTAAGHTTVYAGSGGTTVHGGVAGDHKTIVAGTGPVDYEGGQGDDTIFASAGSTMSVHAGSGHFLFLGANPNQAVTVNGGSAAFLGNAGGSANASGSGATLVGGAHCVLYGSASGGDLLVAGGNTTLDGAASRTANTFFAGAGSVAHLGSGDDVAMLGGGTVQSGNGSAIIYLNHTAGQGETMEVDPVSIAGRHLTVVNFEESVDHVTLGGGLTIGGAITGLGYAALTLSDGSAINIFGAGSFTADGVT